MMHLARRIGAVVLIVSMATMGALGAVTPTAAAQQQVVGSADFRSAPQLPPGTYSDRIVTGDTAWYSLVYSNETAYEFEVSIQGAAPSELNLVASFVAPTLSVVDGPARIVSGNGVVYPAGETNIWFLKVTLETSGQAGLEYPISIAVSGVESAGVAECGDVPGCVLDDEFAALNVALAEAESELKALQAREMTAAVEAEIDNLRGFIDSSDVLLPRAEARLGQNEATMSTLCAPDPMCETFPSPGSKTPPIGFAVGLLAIGAGAFKAIRRFALEPEDHADLDVPKSRTPSAIENARREGVAAKKAAKKADKKQR